MPHTLIRPAIVTLRNQLLPPRKNHRAFNRHWLSIVVGGLVMWGLYQFSVGAFRTLAGLPILTSLIVPRMVIITCVGFLFLLLFSNVSTAMSSLYSSRDNTLLLASPIRKSAFFLSRLTLFSVSSSWTFVLFFAPISLACAEAFSLGVRFLLVSGVIALSLIVICGALASVIAAVVMSIFPPRVVKEIAVVIFSAVMIWVAIHGGRWSDELASNDGLSLGLSLLFGFDLWETPIFPAYSAAQAILSLSGISDAPVAPYILLLAASAVGSLALSYLVFDLTFWRGWNLTFLNEPPSQNLRSSRAEKFLSFVFPNKKQFRAFLLKDYRMFFRDTTQTLQMLAILFLAMLYLYNFKALRSVSEFSAEGYSWWQALLLVANVGLSGCIVSAICARFVFPVVSVEGMAFSLVRAAPIDLRNFLHYKLIICLIPLCLVSLLLATSGALAVQAPLLGVAMVSFVTLMVTIGSVGLAVGVGANYARFDWESTQQIVSSLGSLLYMLLALGLLLVITIPTGVLAVLSCVPNIRTQLSFTELSILLGCSLGLITYLNLAAAKYALNSGEQALAQRHTIT